MKKKLILLTCLCVLASGTCAYAAENRGSVEYNITVNETATNEDYMSKRCKRVETLNDFEVTPTYFNTNHASFWATSIQLYGTVYSKRIYVENGLNESRYGNYTTNAPEEEYYYMSTSYGYSDVGVVNSKGVYRP